MKETQVYNIELDIRKKKEEKGQNRTAENAYRNYRERNLKKDLWTDREKLWLGIGSEYRALG